MLKLEIRKFHTSFTPLATRSLHANRQDGQPAFSYMGLRRLSNCLGDVQNIRYLLQNAKLLIKKSFIYHSLSLISVLDRLHDIVSESASAATLLNKSP